MTFVPHTPVERAKMLEAIGAADLAELYQTIPEPLRLKRELELPPAHGEVELNALAAERLAAVTQLPLNRVFAGAGVYPHHVPAVVDELGGRGEFYTAYTPYQPEVSQGMLQSIYEYQSYICMLTGMEVSNASGYDGGTTLADAVVMARYATKGRRQRVLFAPHVNPEAREVVATYNHGMGLDLVTVPDTSDGRVDAKALEHLLEEDNVAAMVFQFPDYLGYLGENLAELIEQVHRAGALAIVSFYPFAAGLYQTPGELGADIVCGEAQCLGNYMGFGGPLLGFLACREKLVRVMPGRLIGRTACERDGQPGEGFVMTLQAREQHIRRDKATSNICSNEALLALRSCIYLGAVGRQGFTQLATLCYDNAHCARERLLKLPGVSDFFDGRAFFNEFTLRFTPGKRDAVYDNAFKHGILAGVKPRATRGESLEHALILAFTEVHHEADIDALVAAFKEVL